MKSASVMPSVVSLGNSVLALAEMVGSASPTVILFNGQKPIEELKKYTQIGAFGCALFCDI